MPHSPYRDPLDGPAPKWKRHKPVSSGDQDGTWSWSHTGIKPPINWTSSKSPGEIPPTHVSIASVVKKKVAKIGSPQSPTSSPKETPNIQRPTITSNEEFIANQLLQLPNRKGLIAACIDPSGAQFTTFSGPMIQRVARLLEGETINPENVLFLLREKLQIIIL